MSLQPFRERTGECVRHRLWSWRRSRDWRDRRQVVTTKLPTSDDLGFAHRILGLVPLDGPLDGWRVPKGGLERIVSGWLAGAQLLSSSRFRESECEEIASGHMHNPDGQVLVAGATA